MHVSFAVAMLLVVTIDRQYSWMFCGFSLLELVLMLRCIITVNISFCKVD